jgi:hypothetical protein
MMTISASGGAALVSRSGADATIAQTASLEVLLFLEKSSDNRLALRQFIPPAKRSHAAPAARGGSLVETVCF